MFVNKKFEIKVLSCEFSWIILLLTYKNQSIIVCTVYIKPSLDFKIATDLLQEALRDATDMYPSALVVLLGDFNSRIANMGDIEPAIVENTCLSYRRPSLDTIRNARCNNFLEFIYANNLFVINGRTTADHPSQFTFADERGWSVIDYCLANLEMLYCIKNMCVLNNFVCTSTHFPLLLEFNFGADNPCSSNLSAIKAPKLRPASLKWNCFHQQNFQLAMQASPNVSQVSLDTDKLLINFETTLINTAKMFSMFTDSRMEKANWAPRDKPWFDHDCRRLKKSVKNALRSCKSQNFEESSKRNYIKAKKNFCVEIKKKRKAYERQQICTLSNVRDSKEFWDCIKTFRARSPRASLDVATWQSYFDTIYTPKSANPLLFYGTFDPILDRTIDLGELLAAISHTKCNKKPGADMISYEFLKNLPQNWMLYLCSVFNKIISTRSAPERWCQAVLCMLHKKGDRNDPTNYRSIALVNCTLKLFTQILLSRLSSWIDERCAIPETQSGFRKSRGCIDNVFVLSSIINFHIRLKRRKVFAAFVDFKRAFDSVNHELLWHKLYTLGISPNFIHIIKAIYDVAKLRVGGSDGLSRAYDVSLGVLQGETLSPTLFSLFLSDIDDFFSTSNRLNIDGTTAIVLLLYADDLVLLADTERDLQRKLDILSKYAQQNLLTINNAKTKIMCFSQGGNTTKQFNFQLNGENLEMVSTFTYLGVTFAASGVFSKMAKLSVDRAKQAASSTLAVMAKAKVNSWDTITTLFNSSVINTITASLPVWAPRYAQDLETIQLAFFKSVLRLPKSTSSSIVRLESGSIHIEYLVFKLCLTFLSKILSMPNDRLPKKCFNRQLQLLNSTKIQYNWAAQIKSWFVMLGKQHLWDNLNANTLESNKDNILDSLKSKLTETDLLFARNANYTIFYHMFTNYQSPATYLGLSLPIAISRLVAQLRTCTKIFYKFSVKGTTYMVKPDENCSVCNMNVPENFFHVFFQCPMYAEVRLEPCNDPGAFLNQLEEIDSHTAKKLFQIIQNIFRIRAFLRNE